MALTMKTQVLGEAFGPSAGTALRIKQVAMVVLGIAALIVAAKIRFPMWPVPATMQTFAVLTIGASFGLRLSLVTLLGYMALGAVGFNVFTGSSADLNGITYMMGATGGYLVGFVVAAAVMAMLARAGWDRSFGKMAAAMLLGNVIIYAFGLPWMAFLFLESKGAAWVMQWGLTNFIVFDALKLALAAVMFPMIWKLIGDARR